MTTTRGPAEVRDRAARRALDREVVDLLRRYTAVADKLSQVFCDAHDIHRTDLHALMHLRDAARRGESVSAGELSAALGLSTGATTALIDRLERHGHAVRVRPDEDRRRVEVRFGSKVEGVAREFFRPVAEASDQVLAQFTDEELQVVARFLDVMTRTLDAETLRAAAAAAPR